MTKPAALALTAIGLLFAVIATPTLSAGQPTSVDAASLIGNWQGEYLVRSQSYRNMVYIAVKSVTDDGRVSGTIYMAGPAMYHNKDLQLVDAVFKDGRFNFRISENPNLVFDFEVKSKEMTAAVLGIGRTEFTLNK